MIRIFAESETDTTYFWAPLLVDVAAGAGTAIAIIPVGLAFGGFSFIEPWLIVTPILLFAAGFLRGSGPGSAWAKATAISSVAWLLILVTANGPKAMLVGVLAVTSFRLLRGSWFVVIE
jgi:hypothetical protein